MKALKKLFLNQEGAVLVIVALLLIVMMGMTALVADVGILTKSKRQLVTTADAAALAGAQELINITGQNDPQIDAKKAAARTRAKEYAEYNYPGLIVDKDTIEVTVDYSKIGYVEKSVTVPLVKEGIGLTFARVLGHDVGTVAAAAKAAIEYPTSFKTDGKSGNLFPIMVDINRYDELADKTRPVTVVGDGVLDSGDGHGGSGNWGFADFSNVSDGGNSGNDLVKYLFSAGIDDNKVIKTTLSTGLVIGSKTGSLGGSVLDGLDLRAEHGMMRGIIPLVTFGSKTNGKIKDATIMKFVVFEITSYDKANNGGIQGVFYPNLPPSDFMGSTSTKIEYSGGVAVPILKDINK
jgi:hypothetical protein